MRRPRSRGERDCRRARQSLRWPLRHSIRSTYDMTFLWPRVALRNGYQMALAGQNEESVALMEGVPQAPLTMRLGYDERCGGLTRARAIGGRVHEVRDTALGAAEFAKRPAGFIGCWERSRDLIPGFARQRREPLE